MLLLTVIGSHMSKVHTHIWLLGSYLFYINVCREIRCYLEGGVLQDEVKSNGLFCMKLLKNTCALKKNSLIHIKISFMLSLFYFFALNLVGFVINEHLQL